MGASPDRKRQRRVLRRWIWSKITRGNGRPPTGCPWFWLINCRHVGGNSTQKTVVGLVGRNTQPGSGECGWESGCDLSFSNVGGLGNTPRWFLGPWHQGPCLHTTSISDHLLKHLPTPYKKNTASDLTHLLRLPLSSKPLAQVIFSHLACALRRFHSRWHRGRWIYDGSAGRAIIFEIAPRCKLLQ